MMENVRDFLDVQHVAAVDRYNARFDNTLYVAATVNHGTLYDNALIDSALAMCGCPYSRFTSPADDDGWSFLALFAEDVQ